MESSSSASFTSLVNSASTASPDFQQYQSFPPPHFPTNFRSPPYGPSQQPHFPQHFNPFGVQPGYQGYQQLRAPPSSYHGFPYHDGMGQYQQRAFGVGMGGDPSSPVGSAACYGGMGTSGSRGDESASPISMPQPIHGVPVIIEESDSSPEEENNKSGRRYWSEAENLRLVSAWLNNSNDPIEGVDKKYDHYWKEVAKEYNNHTPKDRRRSVIQLKNHWNRYAPVVMKFNQCWNRMKNAHGSGESDDQIMERAHAVFRSENSEKPFLFEYWWRVVKDQPKWGRVYPLNGVENKRTKINAEGAYTSSSNQDTDEASATASRRPIGQKQAKAQRRGKAKAASHYAEGNLSNDTVHSFNEILLRKSEAIEKMAQATSEHAKAMAEQAATKKEKLKAAKIDNYFKLMTIDTTNFNDKHKAGHEKVLHRLTKELFGEDDP